MFSYPVDRQKILISICVYKSCGEKTVIHKPCMILLCFIVLDGLNDEDVYEISSGLFGLVLYNPKDRDGAVEEANNLESSLHAIGCQVMKEEWTTKVTLRTHIDHAMDQMAGNSLLVVCIMSHGNAGKLKCDDGRSEERRVGKECRSRWSPYH